MPSAAVIVRIAFTIIRMRLMMKLDMISILSVLPAVRAFGSPTTHIPSPGIPVRSVVTPNPAVAEAAAGELAVPIPLRAPPGPVVLGQNTAIPAGLISILEPVIAIPMEDGRTIAPHSICEQEPVRSVIPRQRPTAVTLPPQRLLSTMTHSTRPEVIVPPVVLI